MTRRPLSLLLLVVLACSILVAACGGDDGGDDGDATAILRETFGEGKDVKSGRLDLALRLNAKGLQGVEGPIALRLNGPFASQGAAALPRFDFNLQFDAGGQAIAAGAVSTGEKGFVRFQDQAYSLSDDLYKQFKDGYAEQAKCTEEQGGKGGGVSFRTLGIDPSRWLRDAKTAGEEEVGGAETDHVTAGVDVPRFLEDVNRILARTDAAQQADPCAEEGEPQRRPEGGAESRELSEAERKQLAEAIKTARVDVWTGKDDRMMRRINVVLGFEVPEAGRQAARGLEKGDLRFDMTLGGLNEKQEVKTPEGAQPLEQLIAQFGGQVPGLGGGTQGGAGQGGAGQGGGTQGGGGGQGGSPYLECVQAAGNDVRKLQECQDLIGS